MIVSAIVAAGKNGVIGKDNQLLWRLPKEFRYFKKTTTGHHLIVGRKTFEGVGPLPDRTMIVVTRNPNFKTDQALLAHSIPEALEIARTRKESEVFVIGGAEIYRQSWPYLHRIYFTQVDYDGDGDAFFPGIDKNLWKETFVHKEPQSSDNSYAWVAKLYERVN